MFVEDVRRVSMTENPNRRKVILARRVKGTRRPLDLVHLVLVVLLVVNCCWTSVNDNFFQRSANVPLVLISSASLELFLRFNKSFELF